jgi:hypothetical protein
MSEITQEEALRQAAALAGQARRETETRCAVLAQYINDCDSAGSTTSASIQAVRELRALQDYRSGLLRRENLIQQALDCVGERPAEVALTAAPNRTAVRTRQQVQVQRRRR